MNIKYVAIDVETPNRMNNRISSIGISLVDKSGIVTTREYLVNPECAFDDFNISLTGIKPSLVKNSPCFPHIWAEIEPLFINYTIVAHNALFDLSVLQKTLIAYNLSIPNIRYLCTLKMAQTVFPQMDNYKLTTLCDYLDIPINHHHSGSDSEACAYVIERLDEMGIEIENYITIYSNNIINRNKPRTFGNQTFSKSTRALNELNDLVKEISSDGKLTENEISYLICWMRNNLSLKGNYPYDRIYNKLAVVLEDGIITPQEHDELIQLFQTTIDPVEEVSIMLNNIDLKGKSICLSGDFDFGTKEDVSKTLERKGAIMQNSVTRKTNILVVGGKGSSAWSSGNYGTKIKKALELQTKGIEIQIVRETDFFSAIEV